MISDQVKTLNEKSIIAKYINPEQSNEENNQIIQEALQCKIKILYIAPERQENIERIEVARKITFKTRNTVCSESHSVFNDEFYTNKDRLNQ